MRDKYICESKSRRGFEIFFNDGPSVLSENVYLRWREKSARWREKAEKAVRKPRKVDRNADYNLWVIFGIWVIFFRWLFSFGDDFSVRTCPVCWTEPPVQEIHLRR